jgi:hypothetical protein
MKLSRRTILIGTGSVAVLGGFGFEASRLLRKRYAPTPFDDLLSQLDDRDAYAQVGEAVLAGRRRFDAMAVAEGLRQKLKGSDLATVAVRDAASRTLLEAQGWVLPESEALLCALAAKASA